MVPGVSVPECSLQGELALTDGDGLDADALLDVGIGSVVSILALQYLLAAKGVHEGCAT